MKKLIMFVIMLGCAAPAFAEYYDMEMPIWAGGGNLAHGSSVAATFTFPDDQPAAYCYTAAGGEVNNDPAYDGPWFGFHQASGNAGAFSGGQTVSVSNDAVYVAKPLHEDAAHITVRAQIVYKGDCIGVALGVWADYTTPTSTTSQ